MMFLKHLNYYSSIESRRDRKSEELEQAPEIKLKGESGSERRLW